MKGSRAWPCASVASTSSSLRPRPCFSPFMGGRGLGGIGHQPFSSSFSHFRRINPVPSQRWFSSASNRWAADKKGDKPIRKRNAFDRATKKPDQSPVQVLEARDRVLSRLRDRRKEQEQKKAEGRKERDVDAKKRKAREAREAKEAGRPSSTSGSAVEVVGDDVPPATFTLNKATGRSANADAKAIRKATLDDNRILLEERPPPMTVEKVVEILREEKGVNIMVIDVSAKCTFAKHMVIAEGRSGRHLHAMADRIVDEVRMRQDSDEDSYAYEMSRNNDDWLAFDCGDTMVQLFSPGARRYYDLDSLWILQKPLSEASEGPDEVNDVEDLDPLPDLDDVPGGWNPWDQSLEKK